MPLTTKQEAFAAACAKGSTGADAYRVAYAVKKMAQKTVHEQASRLLSDRDVAARVAELRQGAVQAVRLEVEDVFRQLASVLKSDPARLFDAAGRLLPIHKIDDATRAAIASIEVTELKAKGKVVSRTSKIKFWNKNEAIDKAMKHLGLFERDNRQKQDNLAIQINLVGPDPAASRTTGGVVVQANLVDGRRG